MAEIFEMNRVGRYELIQDRPPGDPADLVRARADGDGRAYVVELLEPPAGRASHFVTQLLAEAPSAVRFRHPAAVRVREVEPGRLATHGEGAAVVAYDPASGHPLSAVLARAEETARPLPMRLVLHVALGVAGVLRALERVPWRAGAGAPMCHGALAPSRVWLDGFGGVAVGNVGLARSRLMLAAPLDALALRAPELLDGPEALAPAADVYALGMLIFDLLFGRSVFRRDSDTETRKALLRGIRPRLARVRLDVDPHLEALVEWMLAHQPSERPATLDVVVNMLADALRRLSEGSSPGRQAGAWVSQLFPSGAAWPGGEIVQPASAVRAAPPLHPEDGFAEVLAPAPTPISFDIGAPALEDEEIPALAAAPTPTDLDAWATPPEGPGLAALAPPLLPAPLNPPALELEPVVDDLGLDEPAVARAPAPPPAPGAVADLEPDDAVPGFYEVFEIEELFGLPPEAEPDFESRYVHLGPLEGGGWRRARDRVSGERVLVERLPPHDPVHLEARQRRLRGIETHPALLLSLALWPSDDGAAVVSPDFDGEPLSVRIAKRGPLALVEASRLVRQLLGALRVLHRAGVPHGALHPEAVLVRGSGSELELRLGGLFHVVGGEALTDPVYRAPEQIRGARPSISADVWSAGAVAYFALAGAGPRRGPEAGPPASISSLRPGARGFSRLLEASLELAPERRARGAGALLELLDAGFGAR